MATSKNWEAKIIPSISGDKHTLYVKGEINTGGIHMQASLIKRFPQGINSTILLLDAKPISEDSDTFVQVSYSEELKKDSPQYSTIEIYKSQSDLLLHTIEHIDRVMS